MAEWIRSLTSNHLPLTAVGSIHNRDFGFFHILLRYLYVPEIMHGRAPEAFLYQ
jgi:hypothetical protein